MMSPIFISVILADVAVPYSLRLRPFPSLKMFKLMTKLLEINLGFKYMFGYVNIRLIQFSPYKK